MATRLPAKKAFFDLISDLIQYRDMNLVSTYICFHGESILTCYYESVNEHGIQVPTLKGYFRLYPI